MIVYKITNAVNGKTYIGKTRQKLDTRWKQHCNKKSNSRLLKNAINKYGAAVFKIEPLVHTDDHIRLDQCEVAYIKHFDSMVPNGYNLTSGGEGGYIRSAETRKLLSDANKGKSRPHTEKSKAKLSLCRMGDKNPMYGKEQSEETKLKRSKALLGKKRPQWVKDKISAGHRRRNAKR